MAMDGCYRGRVIYLGHDNMVRNGGRQHLPRVSSSFPGVGDAVVVLAIDAYIVEADERPAG